MVGLLLFLGDGSMFLPLRRGLAALLGCRACALCVVGYSGGLPDGMVVCLGGVVCSREKKFFSLPGRISMLPGRIVSSFSDFLSGLP